MPEFLHGVNLSDRQRLEAFPPFLREIIDQTLESRFVDKRMRSHLQAAWKEVQATGELKRLSTSLRDAKEGSLAQHGLLGAQFEAKRQNIERWYDRFEEKARGWIIKRLIGAVRALLGSLLDALGMGGLLREFLDVLNDSIEEEAERA